MHRLISSLALAAALHAPASLLAAQPAQALSIQGSVVYGQGPGSASAGPGWEAQLRVRPSSFSIGAGAEHTFHDIEAVSGRDVQLLGGFLEPRWGVEIAGRTEIYLAGRLTLSQIKLREGTFRSSTTGYTLAGGAGLRVRLWRRLRLDGAGFVGYSDIGSVEAPNGPFDLGATTRLGGRLGFSVGVG